MWENNTVEDEIQRNSLEYGVCVNTDRSIPDAKSGLKPVARRIIYDAFTNGYFYSKPHVKSARIVGDTMGRFHPHGDSSIYGAMIRLSQDWVMRYPLIDAHGNNGTILGDGPAASRYTEARLSKIAEDGLLEGIKKKNVDFILNYDESEEEPVTLPSAFPNLLCNPNEGIGWAMGCSWAPHNLREVKEAIVAYLNGDEPMLPGPDFPTGGIVINKNDIPEIMRTGHGSVKIRGRYKIEGNNIVFYEIPYGTRVEPLMEEIGTLCDEEKLTGITDVRNETGKKGGIRLTIEVSKNVSIASVIKELFAKTDLQSTFSYNQVALVGKTPTELNLKDAIKIYVEHNIDCLVRETEFDLHKAEARKEIVDGLLKALEDIDNIIKLIKASKSAAAAKDELIKKYAFTDNQAKAIIDMKLGRLANLEKVEIQNECANLESLIDGLKTILGSRESQIVELMSRLNELVEKYGDARRTELIQIGDDSDESKEEIPSEDVIVSLTRDGRIKRTAKKNFKAQRAAGKGVKVSDSVLNSFNTNTSDNLLLFTSTGKMFKLLVDNIPEGNNLTKGVPVGSLVDTNGEEVIAAVPSNQKIQSKYVVFFTKNGYIKKTDLSEYTSIKKTKGIAAIKLKENDGISNVIFMDDEDVIVVSENGQAIHFETKNIKSQGRATLGVKAIQLKNDDKILTGMKIKDTKFISIFTKNGKGKAVDIDEFPIQERGGFGVAVSKTPVASSFAIDEDSSTLINGPTNSICIKNSDIPKFGRVAMGNMMIQGEINNAIQF